MSDDDVHRLAGYAYVHGEPDGSGTVMPREVLERAVAANPTVPLRFGPGGRYLGEAQLSVDDTGLKITAELDAGIAFLGQPSGDISIREAYTAFRPAQEDKS